MSETLKRIEVKNISKKFNADFRKSDTALFILWALLSVAQKKIFLYCTSVRCSLKSPRAPRVRLVGIRIISKIHSNFAQYTPQIETSESERWEEAVACGAGVGKRARREAMNWDGTGVRRSGRICQVKIF